VRRRPLAVQVTAVAVGVALVVAAAFVVAIVAIISLRNSTSRETHSKDVVAATLQAQTLVVDMETGIRGYVLSGKAGFLAPWQTGEREWPATIARLEALVADDATESLEAHTVDNLVFSYENDYAKPVIAIAHISPAAARAPVSASEETRRIDAIRSELGQILAVENARSKHRAAAAHSVASEAELAAGIGLAASAFLVLLFGAWVNRSVSRPVLRASQGATAIAAGDLSTRLEEDGPGEIATLAQAFNAMTRALEASREELVTQNEQLRENEKAKSDLIAMISHELRTPLSSVLGFTTLLLQRDFDPTERRRYLEIVDSEARRLAELAEDFLDVRLLEEGRLELTPADVDLAELVRTQTAIFFAHARKHVGSVEVPDSPLIVPVDRDRITQVVANLLSNAIKYSPNGGRITVSLRRNGNSVHLAVADDGIGIASADRSRIFEKFFRGRAPSAGIPGTGLGLAVSRLIVEGHGGRIGFDSNEGAGSTFWVDLPVADHVRAPA